MQAVPGLAEEQPDQLNVFQRTAGDDDYDFGIDDNVDCNDDKDDDNDKDYNDLAEEQPHQLNVLMLLIMMMKMMTLTKPTMMI